MTGADIRALIAATTPLLNPRLSEVDWDDVAAVLALSAAQSLPSADRDAVAWAIEAAITEESPEIWERPIPDIAAYLASEVLALTLPSAEPMAAALREILTICDTDRDDLRKRYGSVERAWMAVIPGIILTALAKSAAPVQVEYVSRYDDPAPEETP